MALSKRASFLDCPLRLGGDYSSIEGKWAFDERWAPLRLFFDELAKLVIGLYRV